MTDKNIKKISKEMTQYKTSKIKDNNGGFVEQLLFPAGYTAASTALGLFTASHAVKKTIKRKKTKD